MMYDLSAYPSSCKPFLALVEMFLRLFSSNGPPAYKITLVCLSYFIPFSTRTAFAGPEEAERETPQSVVTGVSST